MTNFEGIVPALGQALSKRGYSSLTPVQVSVSDPDLVGADLLVSAQTGSGKTVAFGLALAPTLLGDADTFDRAGVPLALAIAPTRELALQVKRELEWLYEPTGAKIASCVGGMDMGTERRALNRGAHIVVGTPGRLRDHIERGSFDTSGLRAVVLDEADEMLNMGFREELESILDATPSERRTLMFSATVPRGIANLAKRYQRNAIRVTTAAEEKQHLDIEYRAVMVAPNDQENAIINVLRFYEAKNAIVFCGTRATVNHMTSRFNNRGFKVVALSGELSQNERTHALQAMRDGRARVCVATDVAARGIDLPDLELVIHADIPKNRESLLHRSGRTGRAGRKGVSTLIVPHRARRRTESLLRSAKVDAVWGKPPSAEEILKRDDERLLSDPALTEPIQENETEFAQKMLETFSPEQVATALVRVFRKDRSAPEELLDMSASDRAPREKRERREDFDGGVWFTLTVGRKHNAEPRWLLPMLCKAGNFTKREIGAIKIQQEETHVEIAPQCVESFMSSLGPNNTLEKSITVTRQSGRPAMERRSEQPRGKGRGEREYGNKGRDRSDRPDRKPKRAPYGAERTEADTPPKRARDKKPSYTEDETISTAEWMGDEVPWDKVGLEQARREKPEAKPARKTGSKSASKIDYRDAKSSDARPRRKAGTSDGGDERHGGKPKARKGGKPGAPAGKKGYKGKSNAAGKPGKPSAHGKSSAKKNTLSLAGNAPLKRKKPPK
ncbi:MAG: DEAD/DEAH box helicase [Parvibaculaceae bacterium]|nr:DEAD/DEAH box helicase [Parvibaculaceae bacterium]